ncbi:MAG: MATE family efflux transporter [Clostridiales bacterium]|jgi:putative MATE family efflux protein|nr:MATE family efflux transporter [Clostridiales bacterium]MDW7660323.1 MATE family efflux transporter [Bacillota bacterium]
MISLGFKKNKSFYKILFGIMLPIALQNLISSSLNLVDNVMIGQLGETHITSVGLANQVFFLMTLILFGANSGTSIFVAQYWGRKEVDKIKKVLSVALWFSLIISTAFFIAGFLFPNLIIGFLSKDLAVVKLGVEYLQIVSLSYVMTAISFAYGFSSRSIGKPKLPMYASAISLLVNTFLNYILIFGHFGFPAYGVKGAAIATLIARTIEVTIILVHIYRNTPELSVRLSDMLSVGKSEFKRIGNKAFPVILNETFWALGMTTYALVYARIGTEAAASVMISTTVNNLFMVISFGLGNASAVMLGNTLGADEIDTAIEYNKKFLSLSLLGGVVVGGLIFVFSPIIVSNLYNLGPVAYDSTMMTLKIMAFFMPFKFYNTIVVIGTLRSGGDTMFSMFLEMGSVWLIGVPLAFIGAFVWGLPVYWVVALVSLEEIAKMFLGFPRVLSNKWAKNIVSSH